MPTDSSFQRQLRLLQALWREQQGYPMGEHRGRPLGSRLPMPWAEETLANFVTPAAKQAAAHEWANRRQQRKLFGYPRLFSDLLSSQPLCFNLFAEMQADRDMACSVFADLTGGKVGQVTGILLEHSPGRGQAQYSGDHSAFDAYVEFTTTSHRRGFIGVEVKYHEDLRNSPSPHRERYDEVADLMQCFRPTTRSLLRERPLQQLWRDHLLAGSLVVSGAFDLGIFAVVYPGGNAACAAAIEAYRGCLSDDSGFAVWTLEHFAATLARHCNSPWVAAFNDRYLDFARLERA